MRQAGIIAAGAVYALQNHIERLAEDHANAQRLADCIRKTDGLTLRPDQVDTNIVIFEVDKRLGTGSQFAARLAESGVLMIAFGPQLIRAVTHLDVSEADTLRACEVLEATAKRCARKIPPCAPPTRRMSKCGVRCAAVRFVRYGQNDVPPLTSCEVYVSGVHDGLSSREIVPQQNALQRACNLRSPNLRRFDWRDRRIVA